MANVISRSWEITKLSFQVINHDKELLLFEVLAGILSFIFLAAMLLPTVSVLFMKQQIPVLGFVEYLLIFLSYLGLSFITTFFNFCVVYTSKRRFEGGNATFGESIKHAFLKIHLIFAWSLVSATIGTILRVLDRIAQRMGFVGRLILMIFNALLGLLWSIITLFVIPVMVYQNVGPFTAIKRSAQVFKKTWGESIIRVFGLGAVQFLFSFAGFVIFGMLFILSAMFGVSGMIFVFGAGVLYVVGVMITFSLANTIFNTALYVYAETGRIPGRYSKEVMQGAFGNRKQENIMVLK